MWCPIIPTTAIPPPTPARARRRHRPGWTGCARSPIGCALRRRRTRRPIWVPLNGGAAPGWPAIATNGAGDVVDEILGVNSTRGATLLGDGSLTSGAADLLSGQGPTVAIAAAEYAAQDE